MTWGSETGLAVFAAFFAAVFLTVVFFAAVFFAARLRAGGALSSGARVSSLVLLLIRKSVKKGGWVERVAAHESELIEDFIGDFKVGEDVHRVLIVVELVVKFEDLPGNHWISDDARVL